jgi:magnesium-transporting ATPase (P-type)
MSTLCKNEAGELTLFCKGSPESLAELCEDVPSNYHSSIEQLANKGLRVLALASRTVPASEAGQDRL